MKLVSISVTNYRSITRAHKIKLHDLTILVGKNNEGKSNILKAVALSMDIIKRYAIEGKYIGYYKFLDNELYYKWERDFPVSAQNKSSGSKNSKFELEFNLSAKERIEFNKTTGSRLSTSDFSITIEIGQNNFPNLKIAKKGTSKLNEKAKAVSAFVANNLVFNYIPAIRTESQAIDLIRETLSQELKIVEKNKEYIEAIQTINRLQREPLDGIAQKVKNTLQTFIPTIENVKIDIEENFRRLSLRRGVDVLINDGELTNIEFKGDGIKNLATLAMLTDRYNVEQSSIIAIDEPEAHLHPGSIRQLNNILAGLSKDNQVIISTHNQLFINKSDIKSNIIVSSGKANPAKNIKEIREILGVKLSDNLISCNFKVFVEGMSDKIIIESLLQQNPIINNAINNSEISVESLGGASKLLSKLYESNNTIFNYYVILDNDNDGKNAFENSNNQKLLEVSQTTFMNCPGKVESEIEDLINPEVYLEQINLMYGTDIKSDDLESMSKWSNKIKELFLLEGKPWSESLEKEIKMNIAEICKEKICSGEDIFFNFRKEPINSLIRNIQNIIEQNK